MAFNWRRVTGIHIDSGDGSVPDHNFFRFNRSKWQGDGIHDNPRFFKVFWKIWTTCDLPKNAVSETFHQVRIRMAKTPVLSFHDAMQKAQEHYDNKVDFLIGSYSVKRLGKDTPWDEERIECPAISYDDDTDPEFYGHK